MILITNDDGIYSPGIHALWEALKSIGHTIVVVAPSSQKSATSHSITISKPIRIKEVKIANGFSGFSVSGTPADCTKIALKSILNEKPKVLISGINLGANVGNNILYSGTVSSAMEGTMQGIPSIAISLNSFMTDRFELSKILARDIVNFVLENNLPKGTMLNVNVPDIVREKFLGIRVTKQGNQFFNDDFDQRTDPRGQAYYWMKGEIEDNDRELIFDGRAILDGYASVTPISYNMTNESYIPDLEEKLLGE